MRFLFTTLTIIWLVFGWICYRALQPEPPVPVPWHAAQALQSTTPERIENDIARDSLMLSADNMTTIERAKIHYFLAKSYWMKTYLQDTRIKQVACLELSLRECLAALKYFPEDPLILYSTADLYHQLKKYDEAKPYYDKALKLEPDNPHFLRRYYEMLEESGRQVTDKPSTVKE